MSHSNALSVPSGFAPVKTPSDPQTEQELAWIGDAVLALFAREYVLKHMGRLDTAAFLSFTNNAFLSAIGPATRIEAEVGVVYQQSGLGEAYRYIESRILPLWQKQEAKRVRQRKK